MPGRLFDPGTAIEKYGLGQEGKQTGFTRRCDDLRRGNSPMNRVLPPQQRFEAYYCMRVQSHDGLELRAKGAGFDGSTQIALEAGLAFEPVIEMGIEATRYDHSRLLCH